TNPLDSGLGWVVKLDKPDFVGKAALQKIKADGVKLSLVGLKILDRGIARHGYDVLDAEGQEKVGVITSGTHAPSLGYPIAIASIRHDLKTPGTKLQVKIRDKAYPAEVVATPFYKRPV
ncbi:MAG: glycine cleavage system aminomethyltransferase GcvT, partial [Proteobacteria bacterium]